MRCDPARDLGVCAAMSDTTNTHDTGESHDRRDANGRCGRVTPDDAGDPADVAVWIERSVRQLMAVSLRCGPRYARRLEQVRRARDPTSDLLTLAARRLLPLARPVKRVLPSSDLPIEARAQLRLTLADRDVLWQWHRRDELGKAERLHLLAAVQRLAEHAQAVRKESCAPPAEFDGPAHGPPS